MSLQCGIVGLPNVGKSSLFNSLTNADIPAENYPFCTIDPNVGVVEVPDERLKSLQECVHAQKVIPAIVEFVDIAGLVKGAATGEGLGNQFLSNIRQVDAIVHLVRNFTDPDVTHVDGNLDPKRDIETIECELILADLSLLAKAKERLKKVAKLGKKEDVEKLAAINAVIAVLDTMKLAKELPPEQKILLHEYNLLTLKPTLYLFNVDEDEYQNSVANSDATLFLPQDTQRINVCVKLEAELSKLEDDERKLFMQELGVTMSGLDSVTQQVYSLLGLHTFFTAGEKEVRAWTINKNDNAVTAASKIHNDFAKGFIRAETVHYSDFITHGGWSGSKQNGSMQANGKEYVIKNGDVINFLFNV